MINNKKIISFHKLGPYREDFTRCIEKQLNLTEGECFNFLNYMNLLYLHVKQKYFQICNCYSMLITRK